MNNSINLEINDSYTGIEHRLSEVEIDLLELSPLKITGKFLYFTFNGNEPSIKEFVEFIYPKIIPFCIPKTKRDKLNQLYQETQDPKYILELTDQAKNLFIKAAKTLKRGGEPGELILFSILEYYFQAPQIASKMYLKTSEKMPVHGTDGIHARYDETNDRLYLYWGESKLYKSLSNSLDKICDSIKGFIDFEEGRSPKDRDIDILKDHCAISDQKTKDAVLEYFDPYTDKPNKLRQIYCCFSGFDYQVYKDLLKINEDEVEDYFREKYLERIKSACSLFKDKLESRGIHDLVYIFCLIPFQNLEDFRKMFFTKLGADSSLLNKVNSND